MSNNLAQCLVAGLIQRGETLSCAESCTGGLLSASLTAVPGSSSVFWGGWVTYDNDAKITQLDVPPQLIQQDGAVSAGVAKAMAWGARVRSGSDHSIAITGIAGPGGGSEEKPVGTVWIAWCSQNARVQAKKFHFQGDRTAVRDQSVFYALDELLQTLGIPKSNISGA
ncbi:MAG: nicotinamide-nucleotide amidohydrolase family protein [Spirochaetales bacterium]|nr:nicotinamide-nucleotide amidohydrolase family protein [Spirochaetales bacterium]